MNLKEAYERIKHLKGSARRLNKEEREQREKELETMSRKDLLKKFGLGGDE